MSNEVYLPLDCVKFLAKSGNRKRKFQLIGYKLKNIHIVVQLLEIEAYTQLVNRHVDLGDLEFIGTVNGRSNGLDLECVDDFEYPVVRSKDAYSVIIFVPPDFKNLEYFTIEPILLQSTGVVVSDTSKLSLKMKYVEPIRVNSGQHIISDDAVLDKLNQVLKTRIFILKFLVHGKSQHFSQLMNNGIVRSLRHHAFEALLFVITIIQRICIFFIWLLNHEFHGVSLVSCSHVLRQTDLRLKQINYFPIQFLCYYDKSILYEDSILLKELKLPIFNSNLNINNSNYINFYNSIWIIVNDMLLGVTMYKLIIVNIGALFQLIKDDFVGKVLFDDLFNIISWVSFNHPAGFKLNNELGSFVGDLFLWSLKFWKFFIKDLAETSINHEIQQRSIALFSVGLKVLCYCGFTFFLGIIIDFLKVVTFHIYCFYFASTRIYKRQIDFIKSLLQLFRGKKYNVLRDRIDSLETYANKGDFFEVDRLLLGTLLFMVLIFLLPTVFAFYIMFFLQRLMLLISLNFLENITIFINFMPLFVVLLKFKNSRRLQGGINIQYIRSYSRTSYLRLSNKSLSYREIFASFIRLFKNSKNFKTSLLGFFLVGELISMKYNHDLKFHYLMLPMNYHKTIEIWKFFKK